MGVAGRTILVVEDKKTNLTVLETILHSDGYQVVTAEDGVQAWELLENRGRSFHAILLDRIMPNMDGMEVLKKIKAHPQLRTIPVIMQTSANASHEVVEGIEAGAYYYLTKPYQKKVLLGLVKAAIKDAENQQALKEEVRRNARTWNFLESGIFRFRSLAEARELASLLANGCPEPERAVLGLGEILINAVEHGNLNISYEEKSRLEELDQLDDEIERRLTLPEHASKFVEVMFVRKREAVEITVTDQGEGFDWQSYLSINEERAFDSHGRGIAMARMLSFDKLEYQGNGNRVVCTIYVAPINASESPVGIPALAI